jgi:hypothetical protein
MKKLIFILVLICLSGTVSAEGESEIYDIKEALKQLDVAVEKHPKNLPGAGEDPAAELKWDVKFNKMAGKPFIITYYIQKIAKALTGVVAAVAVLFIIQNSFNLLTAAGGTEQITKSKKGLMWSLIGLVMIMGAYIVVKTVISLPYSAEENLDQLHHMESKKATSVTTNPIEPPQRMQPRETVPLPPTSPLPVTPENANNPDFEDSFWDGEKYSDGL